METTKEYIIRRWNGETFLIDKVYGQISMGHRDRNGQLLFEGDIVIAEWHWTEPHVITYPQDSYDMGEFAMEGNCELIGNVTKNPELLNE